MGIKKINVALFLNSDLNSGGGFQYESMVMRIIENNHFEGSINFKYYSTSSKKIKYENSNTDIKTLNENFFQKIHRKCLENFFIFKALSKLKLSLSSIERKLLNDEIDIVYFLSPNGIAFGLTKIPYIFTLWDLGHLDLVEFPEMSYNQEFESRELLYQKSLKKAFRVFVDSNFGKDRVIEKYNIDDDRVEVLKFLPNIPPLNDINYLDIKKKYNIKNEFIFYPAQFWAHKNHIYILKALSTLRAKSIDIDVVFSGFDKGNLQYVLKKSEEFGIRDLVHYVGFISDPEKPYFYNQSLALVMPTYLGPSNIPPLEAFAYGTPVVYSDLPFFREQTGEAAFYVNLNRSDDLVENLIEIKNNEELVNLKIQYGKQVLESWNETLFYQKILSVFEKYKFIRERWHP
jgi:glycosyltransferase involved in cell wall biosynthesis